MADDVHKVSDDAQNDGPVIGTFKTKKLKSPWPKRRAMVGPTQKPGKLQSLIRPKMFMTLGLVVVVAIAGVLLLRKTYVLEVSDAGKSFKITQKEYDVMIEQAKQTQTTEDAAKQTIIKAYKYKIVAPSLKLEPSSDTISKAAQTGANYSGEGSLNEWQQLYGYASGVESNLKFAKSGGYKGSKFVYQYHKTYYTANPDEAAITASRKATLEKVTRDHDELKSGKVTAAALLDRLLQDKDFHTDGGGNPSKSFLINSFGTTYLDSDTATFSEPDYVMSAITSLNKKPGVSDIGEIFVTTNKSTRPVAISYFFVSISDVLDAKPSIDANFGNKLNEVKVEDHAK